MRRHYQGPFRQPLGEAQMARLPGVRRGQALPCAAYRCDPFRHEVTPAIQDDDADVLRLISRAGVDIERRDRHSQDGDPAFPKRARPNSPPRSGLLSKEPVRTHEMVSVTMVVILGDFDAVFWVEIRRPFP
jgi:hypothetical protein